MSQLHMTGLLCRRAPTGPPQKVISYKNADCWMSGCVTDVRLVGIGKADYITNKIRGMIKVLSDEVLPGKLVLPFLQVAKTHAVLGQLYGTRLLPVPKPAGSRWFMLVCTVTG